MNMFPNVLDNIPKIRSELVNYLEIPEITSSPYIWSPEESLMSGSTSTYDDEQTLSSESSLALSRAMTDSEIDYGWHGRWKNRSYSDPWDELNAALDAFPPSYLDSLKSFETSSEPTIDSSVEKSDHAEQLRLKMERFFEDECSFFTPEDPAFMQLQEALQTSNYNDSEVDSSISSSLT